ncbi:MAG TPA: hypothetical protein VI636_03855 [Candidatus Angelobacter sp.]
MYVEALTAPDIEFGKRLWESLRTNTAFPINGILWLFRLQSGEWHLMIATSRVDAVGPKDAYAELASFTKSISASWSQLPRIELISPRHPFYQALRSVFGETTSVEGARLGNTQIGGMYIDDAYLYEIR